MDKKRIVKKVVKITKVKPVTLEAVLGIGERKCPSCGYEGKTNGARCNACGYFFE